MLLPVVVGDGADSVTDLTGADTECVTDSGADAGDGTGDGDGVTTGTGAGGSEALTSTGPTLASTVPDEVTPTSTVGTNDPHAAGPLAKKHANADTQKQIAVLWLRAAMRGRLYLNIPTQCLPRIAAFIHAIERVGHSARQIVTLPATV